MTRPFSLPQQDRELFRFLLLIQEFTDGCTPAGIGQISEPPDPLVKLLIRTDYEDVIVHGKSFK